MSTFSNSTYLLDSNILIYLLQKHEKVFAFIKSIEDTDLSIASISRTELLMGAKKETLSFSELQAYVDLFEYIPLSKEVADTAAELYLSEKYPLRFKDLLIASTALTFGKTLVTADKAFERIQKLQTVIVSL